MARKKRFIRMEDGTRVPHPEDLFGPEPIHDASPMAREAQRIAQKMQEGNQQEGIDPFTNESPETPQTQEELRTDAFDLLRPDREGAAERRGEGEEASPTGGDAGGGGDDVVIILRELVTATNLNTELLQQISDSLEQGIKMTF